MLLDSSAWIEFLRATGSPPHLAVRQLLHTPDSLIVCEPVAMEVVAGARSEQHAIELQRLLARGTLVATEPTDWVDAARIYRTGRRRGLTVRKLIDCLIAAIALRIDESVLHHDADFDAIAQLVPLHVTRKL
ncbi:MAG TPA: PIN domain nuclease [Microbacterium sp.]|nr:PIN domain nuclease [Microbacterium sp.]